MQEGVMSRGQEAEGRKAYILLLLALLLTGHLLPPCCTNHRQVQRLNSFKIKIQCSMIYQIF